MERRMALLKQKEEMAGSTHIVASPPPKPGTMSYTEPIVSPFEKNAYKKYVCSLFYTVYSIMTKLLIKLKKKL